MTEETTSDEHIHTCYELRDGRVGECGDIEHAIVGYSIGGKSVAIGVADADVHERTFQCFVIDREACVVLHAMEEHKEETGQIGEGG